MFIYVSERIHLQVGKEKNHCDLTCDPIMLHCELLDDNKNARMKQLEKNVQLVIIFIRQVIGLIKYLCLQCSLVIHVNSHNYNKTSSEKENLTKALAVVCFNISNEYVKICMKYSLQIFIKASVLEEEN